MGAIKKADLVVGDVNSVNTLRIAAVGTLPDGDLIVGVAYLRPGVREKFERDLQVPGARKLARQVEPDPSLIEATERINDAPIYDDELHPLFWFRITCRFEVPPAFRTFGVVE